MLLDMSKNQLRSLPFEIGQCSLLADLYLDENQIGYLPDTIGRLIFCPNLVNYQFVILIKIS